MPTRETKAERVARENAELEEMHRKSEQDYFPILMKSLERVSALPVYSEIRVVNDCFEITWDPIENQKKTKFNLPVSIKMPDDYAVWNNLVAMIYDLDEIDCLLKIRAEENSKKAAALAKLTEEEKKLLNLA